MLEKKKEHPRKIYLLQGNHEGFPYAQFSGADFWYNLQAGDYKKYQKKFNDLPLAISVGDIIATHSCLPDIENIKEINKIKIGSDDWYSIVWPDMLEKYDIMHPRVLRDREYFDKIMKRFNKNLLIRGHQYNCPLSQFDDRCVTIFTSLHYINYKPRQIAIADFRENKKIETIDDLIIEEI